MTGITETSGLINFSILRPSNSIRKFAHRNKKPLKGSSFGVEPSAETQFQPDSPDLCTVVHSEYVIDKIYDAIVKLDLWYSNLTSTNRMVIDAYWM